MDNEDNNLNGSLGEETNNPENLNTETNSEIENINNDNQSSANINQNDNLSNESTVNEPSSNETSNSGPEKSPTVEATNSNSQNTTVPPKKSNKGIFAILAVLIIGGGLVVGALSIFGSPKTTLLGALGKTGIKLTKESLDYKINDDYFDAISKITKNSFETTMVLKDGDYSAAELGLPADTAYFKRDAENKIYSFGISSLDKPMFIFSASNEKGNIQLMNAIYNFNPVTFGDDFIAWYNSNLAPFTGAQIPEESLKGASASYDSTFTNMNSEVNKKIQKEFTELIKKGEFTKGNIKLTIDGTEQNAKEIIVTLKNQDIKSFLSNSYKEIYKMDISPDALIQVEGDFLVKFGIYNGILHSTRVEKSDNPENYFSFNSTKSDLLKGFAFEFSDGIELAKVSFENISTEKEKIVFDFKVANKDSDTAYGVFSYDSTSQENNLSVTLTSKFDESTLKMLGSLYANNDEGAVFKLHTIENDVENQNIGFSVSTNKLSAPLKLEEGTKNFFETTISDLIANIGF